MKKTVSIVLVAAMLASILTLASFAATKNMWGSSIGEVFLDGKKQEVGYRFAISGNGTLVSIKPYLAGSDNCTFDFKLYAWAGNYADTVKTEPIYSQTSIAFNGSWTNWTNAFTMPEGVVTKGEYLAVMDNYQNVGWSIRNYVFGPLDGGGKTKVYSSGVEYLYNEESTSLQWQFEFDNAWYGTLSEDTEPTPSLDPVEPTRVISTWGEGIQMGNDRFDGVGTAEVGYRFVTTGSNGKLVAIIPYMAGTAGEFDCLVYAWNTDYATTVAGEPLVTVRDIEFDGSTWNTFDNRNVNSKIYLGSGLDAGEYLAVLTNFDDTSWAICSYRMAPSTGFRAYFNGVPAEYEGGYKSLAWQLGFTGDGNALRTELVDPAALPSITASISDAAGDDKIDHLYLNAAISASETRQVGIIFSDTEASCEVGKKPLFIRVAEEGHGKSAGGFIQSGCYGGNVITAANLGGEEDDSVIAVYWQEMPRSIGTLYARTFAKNSDGTYEYGAIATIALTD